MKKILFIILTLVIIASNIFSSSLLVNKQINSFVYEKQKIQFDYRNDVSVDSTKLLNHMIQFSIDHNINISQYNFMSENELNIYSTNIKSDPSIHLEEGTFPLGSSYISNKKTNLNNKKQSGIFSFPLSRWKVRIYDYQQVRNVGIGNQFFCIGADKNVIDSLIKEFSIYAKISVTSENTPIYYLINKSLLMVTLFSFIVFFMVMLYYLIQNRKMTLIQELWGYSKSRTSFSVLKLILCFLTSLILVLFFALLILIAMFKQGYFLRDYVTMFIATNVTVELIIMTFTLMVNYTIHRFNNYYEILKDRIPFKNFQWISVFLKGATCIIMFSLVSTSLINYNNLKIKIDNYDYWKKTQNVFKIRVGSLLSETIDNYKADRDYNNRASKFYKELEKSHNAFLMESDNFGHIYDNIGRVKYFYTLNTQGEEEIYSPYGRRVIINSNYLLLNPIKSSNKEIDIVDQIQKDEDTLNILVPEQYKDYEERIIDAYKEWFYFYKVDVDNIYNRELGYPLNNQSINDLKVNIIYTQKGQLYFTFDTYTGDSLSQVEDPIAVIFNEHVDTSCIGSYTTRSLYFLDNSKGNTFNEIKPLLYKINMPEIDMVYSVYSEAGNQIAQLKKVLFQQIMALCISIVFLIFLFLAIIWTYYNANIQKLHLKYLFGYSDWESNRSIILVAVGTYLVTALVIILKYRTVIFTIIPLIGLALIIDLFFINRLSTYLSKKNINKLLKGDNL